MIKFKQNNITKIQNNNLKYKLKNSKFKKVNRIKSFKIYRINYNNFNLLINYLFNLKIQYNKLKKTIKNWKCKIMVIFNIYYYIILFILIES